MSSSPRSTTAPLDAALAALCAPVRELAVTFATENPSWGYTRLLGALRNLGHELGRNTVKRILKDHGLEPAPSRAKRMPWKTFLKAHLGAIAATDFFSVEVLTLTGLVRYFVLFVIDLETRRVQIAGLVPGWPPRLRRGVLTSSALMAGYASP